MQTASDGDWLLSWLLCLTCIASLLNWFWGEDGDWLLSWLLCLTCIASLLNWFWGGDGDWFLSWLLCLTCIASLLNWFLYDLSTLDFVVSSVGVGFFSVAFFAICFRSFCFINIGLVQPAIFYSYGLGFYAFVKMALKMVVVYQCSSSAWPHGHLPLNATELALQLGVECLHSQVVLGWILVSIVWWLFMGAILSATTTDFSRKDVVVEKEKSAGEVEKGAGESGQGNTAKKGLGKADPDKKTPKDNDTC